MKHLELFNKNKNVGYVGDMISRQLDIYWVKDINLQKSNSYSIPLRNTAADEVISCN